MYAGLDFTKKKVLFHLCVLCAIVCAMLETFKLPLAACLVKLSLMS